MPEATPNLQVIIDHVKAQSYYQGVYHLGVYNCRRIADSQTFSQHSWPNAVDIHVTNGTWVATPEEKAVGDAIKADLIATFGDDLYENIWWSSSHWNHLHVSAYPKGWLTPPCAGGALRIKYRNGVTKSVDAFPLTINYEGGNDVAFTDHEVEELRNLVSALDAVGSNGDFAKYAVELIREWRSGMLVDDNHARSLANKALNTLAAIREAI